MPRLASMNEVNVVCKYAVCRVHIAHCIAQCQAHAHTCQMFKYLTPSCTICSTSKIHARFQMNYDLLTFKHMMQLFTKKKKFEPHTEK